MVNLIRWYISEIIAFWKKTLESNWLCVYRILNISCEIILIKVHVYDHVLPVTMEVLYSGSKHSIQKLKYSQLNYL